MSLIHNTILVNKIYKYPEEKFLSDFLKPLLLLSPISLTSLHMYSSYM